MRIMYKIISIFIVSTLLFGVLFSCENDRDLNEKIIFFSKQNLDPLVIGSWKNTSSQGRIVEVVDFLENGRYRSNMGTPYFRYYTKDNKLYLLRTGNHSNNPIIDTMDYKLNGDSLILIPTYALNFRSIYIKL